MSEDFNMTLRKFLKQVGVTSQKAIEDAIRNAPEDAAGGDAHKVRMVLTIDGLGLEHVVTGTISGRP